MTRSGEATKIVASSSLHALAAYLDANFCGRVLRFARSPRYRAWVD
jgi:hypothetical protein